MGTEMDKVALYHPAELDTAKQSRRCLLGGLWLTLVLMGGVVTGIVFGVRDEGDGSSPSIWTQADVVAYRTFRTGTRPDDAARVAVPVECAGLEAVAVVHNDDRPWAEPGVVAVSLPTLTRLTAISQRFANRSAAAERSEAAVLLETRMGAVPAEGAGFAEWDYVCPNGTQIQQQDFGPLQWCTPGPFNRTLMVVSTWSAVVNLTNERAEDARQSNTTKWALHTLQFVLSPAGNVTQGEAPVVLAEVQLSGWTVDADEQSLLLRRPVGDAEKATRDQVCRTTSPSFSTYDAPAYSLALDSLAYTAVGTEVPWAVGSDPVASNVSFAVDGAREELTTARNGEAATAHWFNASGMYLSGHADDACAFSTVCNFACDAAEYGGRLFVPVGRWSVVQNLAAAHASSSSSATPQLSAPVDAEVYVGLGVSAVGMTPAIVYGRKLPQGGAFIAGRDQIEGNTGRSTWFGNPSAYGPPAFAQLPLRDLWPQNCSLASLQGWLHHA